MLSIIFYQKTMSSSISEKGAGRRIDAGAWLALYAPAPEMRLIKGCFEAVPDFAEKFPLLFRAPKF